MLEMTESAVEIPPHVPAEFVREYPIVQGRYVEEDPYKTIIPAIHQWPPVFYATNAYPGSTPAWVLRRAADVREAYKDTEHFSSMGRSEEHTSELQSLMRISYAVFCLKK